MIKEKYKKDNDKSKICLNKEENNDSINSYNSI